MKNLGDFPPKADQPEADNNEKLKEAVRDLFKKSAYAASCLKKKITVGNVFYTLVKLGLAFALAVILSNAIIK